VITNGAIQDFAGHALAGFFGQLDSTGRITPTTLPVQGTIFGQLEIKLGQTTRFGTYRSRISDRWNFRSTIRFWREKKPTVDNVTASSSFFFEMAAPPVGNNAITNIVVPVFPPAEPAAPNP
jgi:hypothetical protein